MAFSPSTASLIVFTDGGLISFQSLHLIGVVISTIGDVISLSAGVQRMPNKAVKSWPTGHPFRGTKFSVWALATIGPWFDSFKDLRWSAGSRDTKQLNAKESDQWGLYVKSEGRKEAPEAVLEQYPPAEPVSHDEESRGEVPASREAIKRAWLSYGGQWYGGHEEGSAKCPFGCTIEGRTRDQLAPHLTKIGTCVHREDPANKAKVDDILAGRRNKDADILWMFAPQPPADAPPSLSSSSPPPPSPSASSNDQPEVPAGGAGGPPG